MQAEIFQDNCHYFCEKMIKENPKLTYQDCVNTWTFAKLAELELQINELKFKLRNTDVYGK